MATLAQFRERTTAEWGSLDIEAGRRKDPYFAWERKHSWYRELGEGDRELADHVLGELVLSECAGTRFDAQSLIWEYRITSAMRALGQLARRLATDDSPSARDELSKVREILTDLGAPAQSVS